MQLPMVLERSDVRVVHACWDDKSINSLRKFDGNPLEAILRYSRKAHKKAGLESNGMTFDLLRQNLNPVKVTTSGLEIRTKKPYLAGGKLRKTQRQQWWLTYEGPLVVFGHYWRKREKEDREPTSHPDRPRAPNMFTDYHPMDFLGPSNSHVLVV